MRWSGFVCGPVLSQNGCLGSIVGYDKVIYFKISVECREPRLVRPPPMSRLPKTMDLNRDTPYGSSSLATRVKPGGEAIQEEHFDQLRRWLQLESAAEAERLAERRKRQTSKNAERGGETLLDMVVTDHDSGLGGRYLLTLRKRTNGMRLPWNRLRVGAPVVLSDEETHETGMQGVVSARDQVSIQVAVNEWPDAEHFRIDLSPDEITRKRQLAAIDRAENGTGRIAELRDVLLGEVPPCFDDETEIEFNTTLDDSQQAAVRFGRSANDVAVIHGPPGTGKTTTVVELICQAVARGDKVIACAPSNTAVDNLLERLAAMKQNVVRVGHPARVIEGLRRYTLDAMVESHEVMQLVREMMKDAERLFRKAGRFTRGRPAPGAKQQWRREARELKTQARMLERDAVNRVLDNADVICATATFDEDVIGQRHFDLAVIDEACQSTEPGCWVPLLCADKVVLAGDHCQLPPTVLSDEASREGFKVSMLERLIEHYGESVHRRLGVQYRMHEQIMRFSSDRFYDGTLIAHESVQAHLLSDDDDFEADVIDAAPITFIDTAGADYTEELEPDGLSKRNPLEAKLVVKKVEQLFEAGVAPHDLAVIAPYAAQVRLIRDELRIPSVEVDTVDGFQGREKEAVVISLVRSNQDNEIGFLADTRRMNVALTRARKKLIVVGDSSTLGGNEFYASLFGYFEKLDAYRSVWEEAD